MPLDFPSNPTNGQIYDNYYWDNAAGVWNSLGNENVPTILNNAVFGTSSLSQVPLTAKGAGSQAANLQEWKNNSGTVLASMSASGGLTLNNPLSVDNGGTGATSLTSGGYLKGNGTSAIQSQSGIPATDVTSGTLNRNRLPAANWAVSNGNAVTVNSTTPTTIASLSITTRGNPIFLCGTGDMNPQGAATWNYIRIFRDATPIGKFIICESTANSVNNPFALTHIDTPAAGTYNYTIKAYRGGAADALYGETSNEQAPQLIAFELF